MNSNNLTLEDIDLFIFDFDGVLTDNLVYVDQNGLESVRCSRADGLAFDVLRKLKKSVYILSTEKNTVVSSRAEKLGVPVIQGVSSKEETLKGLVSRQGYQLENILYVGNDLNDFQVMSICGFTACPADSHEKIKQISTIVLQTNGGFGVVRELIEGILNLDFIKILYGELY
jgi:YrbI family 3-deoxy-D-manno-octulosonate 8-phosphate phosphatase